MTTETTILISHSLERTITVTPTLCHGKEYGATKFCTTKIAVYYSKSTKIIAYYTKFQAAD